MRDEIVRGTITLSLLAGLISACSRAVTVADLVSQSVPDPGASSVPVSTAQSHPVLFLTPSKLVTLQAKVISGDADWMAVKARADAMLNSTVPAYDPHATTTGTLYYSYEGAGWNDAIHVLGLAYKMTGNTAYAAKLKQIIDVINAAGNAPIMVDSGYPTRHLPVALALAYDWLYDYLDATTKAAIITTINNWYDWYKASAYNRTDPTGTGNYYSGHLLGFGLASLATYWDNPRGDEIFQFIKGKWDSDVVPAFTTGAFAGGYAVESYCSYGSGNFERLLQFAEAVQSATGKNILGDFGNKIAAGLIYNLKPNRWQASDEGTQSGNTGWVMYGGLPLELSSLLSGSDPDGDEMAYYFSNLAATPVSSATLTLQQPADYVRFLYRSSRPAQNYTTARPLYYRSIGDEHVFVRSGWDDSAVWASFNGGSAHYANHQEQNAGHISVQKGSDYLLVNAGEWRGLQGYAGSPSADFLASVAANTLYFNDGGVYTDTTNLNFEGGQQWYGTTTIQKYEGTSNYVYEKADLTTAYNSGAYGHPVAARTLTYFYRNFVAVEGGAAIFVYDRIRATDPSYIKRLQWYLNPQSQPSINGTLVTTDVGSSRLHLNTVYPAGATLVLSGGPITMKGALNAPRIEVTGPASLDFNPLTVILSTDNTTSTPPITGIDTPAMLGALVAGPSPQAVLLSKDGTPQSSVTYSAAYAGSGHHVLLDMNPGTYDIYDNGTLVYAGATASQDGALSFTAPSGTIQVTQISSVCR